MSLVTFFYKYAHIVLQKIINHSLDGGKPNVKKLFHVLVKEVRTQVMKVTSKSINKMI